MLKFAHNSLRAEKAGLSRFRTTLGAALSCFFLLTAGFSASAQDAAAPAPAAAPAEPAPAAEAPAAVTPEPGLAAYLGNGDPTGTAAEGLTGPGHNAWIMTSAAIVLFMTLPGLALFYGGLVRRKNVLSVLAQCLACATIVPILWWFIGYSFIFADDAGNPFFGGMEYFMFKDVGGAPNTNYLYWVPQGTFAMFQLMFAIITPGLIVGAIAERMKFSAIVLFIVGWMFLVYFPLAHMVWGVTGFMNGVWNANAAIPAIDFAGGTVVHMSSGWSALILCIILGPRAGFGKHSMAPHSMVLCMAGTGMLWVGWYGFNAGSAGAADGIATQAFMTTTLCAAVAGAVWALIEKITRKHASILGFCSGIVAGLVVITPAAGFVTTTSAMIMGVIAGVVCFLGATALKKALKYDDSLDTFGIHGVGGTVGAILTGIFADPAVNAALDINLKGKSILMGQIMAVGVTIALSVVATLILAFILKFALGGLRPSAEEEETGLDITDHGEEGYVLD